MSIRNENFGGEKMIELFFKSVDEHPKKQAVWCDGKGMTYCEFSELVCRYANFLVVNGVQRGDIIGIPMNNSIESVGLIFAAAAIGAGLAPVNPTLPAEDIDAAFHAGNVCHLIARKSFFNAIRGLDTSFISGIRLCLDGKAEEKGIFLFSHVFDDVLAASPERPFTGLIDGDETLILTMTSGSTGAPKPIELSQANKLVRAAAHIDLYNITQDDRILAATPLYHSLAERLVIMPLLIGATAVLLPRFTPVLWLNCVRDQKVSFTIAVSAQLSQVAELLSSPFIPKLPSLRMVVSSSALLEPHVRNVLIKGLDCDFHEMYGTSECSTVTDIDFRKTMEKVSSVGRPLPGVSIKIVDDGGDEKKENEIGEITVKTSLMCAGYYGLPDIMEKSCFGDYFRTGDLGRIDGDGYLYFSGRKKEVIITGGINVYPQDIENRIGGMEQIAECAAFPIADGRLGEVVALAVVAADGAVLTKREVRMFCARHLADFQQPHKVFFLKGLPKNAMGKVMRHRLLEAVMGLEG